MTRSLTSLLAGLALVDGLAFDPVADRPSIRRLSEQRIASLDAQIRQLQESRKALTRLARECGSGAAGPCPILEAFEG